MYKLVIFDIDGVLNKAIRFSERFSSKYNYPISKMLPFFKGPFQQCLVGKADLKIELGKIINAWNYDGSVESLLKFWFDGEVNVDDRIVNAVKSIRNAGIVSVGGTNQEKYRSDYITEKLNLNNVFDKVYSSAHVGLKKPDTRFYTYIAKDQNVDLKDIIFWDDELENVESARSLGIRSYLYTDFDNFQNQVQDELKISIQ